MERKIYRAIDTTNRVVIVHYFKENDSHLNKDLEFPSCILKKESNQEN